MSSVKTFLSLQVGEGDEKATTNISKTEELSGPVRYVLHSDLLKHIGVLACQLK